MGVSQGALCDTSQRPNSPLLVLWRSKKQDSKCHLIKKSISEQGSSHSVWSGLPLPNFTPLKIEFLCSQQKQDGHLQTRAWFLLSQSTCLKQGEELPSSRADFLSKSSRETLSDQLEQGRCPTSRWLKQGETNSHAWLRVSEPHREEQFLHCFIKQSSSLFISSFQSL